MQDVPKKYESVALALGSNLGDRVTMMQRAVKALRPFFDIQKASAIYETPPAYVVDQPSYLNAAITGTTDLAPLALLEKLKQTETDLGREESFRYGPRLIDIDLIFFGDRQIDSPELVLPHPRLAEREFVLRPLADISPIWTHPITGLSVAAMLANLPEATAKRCEDKLIL